MFNLIILLRDFGHVITYPGIDGIVKWSGIPRLEPLDKLATLFVFEK